MNDRQNASTTSKGDYYLHFWGEIWNDNLPARVGVTERDHWFDTPDARAAFQCRIEKLAREHDVCAMFRRVDGQNTHFRTIADIEFEMDGDRHKLSHDFGYAYADEDARFMFHDGNYSCDCNRSNFLGLPKMDCGDRLNMVKFSLRHEP